MTNASRTNLRIVLLLVIALTLPLLVRAQTAPPGDLRATIRAELLSDPRTASLTSAQLDAMVNLLSQQAQQQGLSATDIQWHPAPAATVNAPAAPAGCNGSFTCEMDEAFGFVGSDTTIPFALGAASMGLIWSIAEILHRRKYPASLARVAPPVGM